MKQSFRFLTGLYSVVLVFLLACFVFFPFSGCSTIQIAPTDGLGVCDQIPEGETSTICEISVRVGQKPETVAGVLKVTNLALLAEDVYTAQQALDFIEDVETRLNEAKTAGNGVSYVSAIDYVRNRFLALPAKVQAFLVVVSDFTEVDIGSDKFLTNYDIDLLLEHLDKQRAIVAPFLVT
ncbi:MAG: hypothetical protein JW883_00755 [Deltaproteobacteria bacterium]|nr:hypothetical protein [Deltaproteobacteria bacterium]